MSEHQCPDCSDSFSSLDSLNKHRNKSKGHYVPWQDKDLLEELYIEEKLTARAIAEELQTTKSTVCRWLNRHDIEIDESRALREQLKSPAYIHTHKSGYVYVSASDDTILLHRLLAVAEYGLESVVNNQVHHKNGVAWDNRPENLELMDIAEHAKHHYSEREINSKGQFES